VNASPPTRRDQRLRAIARRIIRHGYTAEEVATCLARAALEYTEGYIGEAARQLGLPAASIEPCLSATRAAAGIEEGSAAAASGPWDAGTAPWPETPDHD
jgi:hypothetical protein